MNDSLTETRTTSALMLPIKWQTPNQHRATRIAVEAGVEALLAVSEPFSLSFFVAAGGDKPPAAGWVVSGVDDLSTELISLEVRDVLDAVVAWQGIGDPEPVEPFGEQSNWFALTQVDGPGRRIVNVASVAWALAMARPHRTTMWIDLCENHPTDTGHQGVRCRVAVNGDGMTASTFATLLAADPPGRQRLTAVPIADRSQAPEAVLPLAMVAHLVGSPSRMPEVWPATEPSSSAELFDRIEQAVPPHLVVFGGSGQGKTTLLEHHQLDSAVRRRPRAVLCGHGDLSERGVPIARRYDDDFVFHDFGDESAPARWNLTVTPPGMDQRSWAATLVTVIKAAFRNPNEEWFGPVGNKSLRVACEVLVRDIDEDGPQPITELLNLLDPSQKRRWCGALERIGDERLTSEVRQVWDMIDNDKQSHVGVWLTSKIEPFVADPRIAAVLGAKHSDVDPSVLAAGTTVIASAPAARLGDEGSNLILGTLLAQLWHHLRSTPRSDGDLVDVFLDEIQRMPHETLVSLLAESRKHGVRLRLATQTPNNLEDRLRDSVLSNCGAVATFRLGTRDAAAIEPLFPTSTLGALTRAPKHWVTTAFGDTEMLTKTEPPLEW